MVFGQGAYVADAHEHYKVVVDVDFGKRKGKMAGRRWRVSIHLVVAAVQDMDRVVAAEIAAAGIVVGVGLGAYEKGTDR